jgi:NAD(P)-dependent dehydrogenase (short-subunit alcohol dehydrogenase family)
MDNFSLSGKVAVVTGALGLLGRQHCRALANAGANVVATDLDSAGLEELAMELEALDRPSAFGVPADISDPDSVRMLHREIMHRFGRIDILVNNAAVNDMVENPGEALSTRFESFPLSAWERSLKVNVTGTYLCCQTFGPSMVAQGSGSIVNIASTYGIVAPNQDLYKRPDGTQTFFKSASYPVTKGAILSFTRFLAAYWGKTGVRVNALSPGGVQNNQDEEFVARYASRTPLGRMAAPDDYHGAIIFLASDASRYMTGANLVVDGGWTII